MDAVELDRLKTTHWVELLARLGVDRPAALAAFDDLASLYASPERHYHTLDHIAQVLTVLEPLAGPDHADNPALLLAAWLHDAIYDPRAGDNEARSAEYAVQRLGPLGVPPSVLAETARLIHLTRTHQTDDDDFIGCALLDADLAVLGADQEAYDRYAQAIRREYAWVPEDQYRQGRAAVLQGFLARPHLYRTPQLRRTHEEPARRNLAREIATLKESGPD